MLRRRRKLLLIAGLALAGLLATAGALAVSFSGRVSVSGTARVAVPADGLYYLDSAAVASALVLEPADVSILILANRIQLTGHGQPIAVLPAAGNSGLYFYGQGSDSRYAEAAVYWLKVGPGAPMTPLSAPTENLSAAPELAFAERLHVERENPNLDRLFLLDDPGSKFLAWDLVVAADPAKVENCRACGKEFEVRSPGASRQGIASLTVHLFGGSAARLESDHDHHSVMYVNGARVGESTWVGEGDHAFTATFDAALLNDGANSVQIAGLLDPGIPVSLFFVDSFDLAYQRLYRAEDERLLFTSATQGLVAVSGFARPDVIVLDVSDARRPRVVGGVGIERVADSYRASFGVAPDRRYLAATSSAVSAASLLASRPANLKDSVDGADYLLLTTAALKAAAGELASYRESQGLEAKVVDLADVYGEFGDGTVDPECIRDFLTHVYANWQPAPRYVLLVGDATLDFKNVEGSGRNLIPPLFVSTPEGLYASDNRFGDVAGDDGVPEMAVGRLPVTTGEEVLAYLDKVKAYESAPGGWLDRILLLSDKADGALDFPKQSESLRELIPGKYTVQRAYLSELKLADARATAFGAIQSGVSLVSYVGHGNIDRFADGGLLTVGDVEGRLDGPVSPVFVAITCVSNLFYAPNRQWLGESLVTRRGGGATAVWAPTGRSIDVEAAKLGTGFTQTLFASRPIRLGDVTNAALRAYASGEHQRWMLEIYELLGDPALLIR